MQKEHLRRGFAIYVHQKVVLEVDFSGALWGYTEITVLPQTKDLRTIHLHSRQCAIHSVTVASQPVDFVHHDPVANLSVSNPSDCHTHAELKRKVYSALAEGDEGELSISIPKEMIIRQAGNSAAGFASEAATPEPQTPGFMLQSAVPVFEFAPIQVVITYSLRNPADGVEFIVPSDAYPYRVPHAYTTPSSPDSARCWVPCIDNIWEKATWEFEFVVPRYLEQQDGSDDDDEDEDAPHGDYPTVVICSGELLEQISHPHNSAKTIFLFAQATPTSVQHIAWAAGPYHVHTVPADLSSAEDTSGSTQPLMHAFCLPGHESQLTATISFMRSAMSFYTSEFGSYPFGSHKVVFVDELPTQRFDAATLSLVSVDLLHGEDAIDQVYEARLCLSHALACQWIGINIQPKMWSDSWLVNGLGLYITGLYLRKLLGNNEYRYRLKKDMERVLHMDNGSMPPICQPQIIDPPDPNTLAFINIKAPLVLHILDRRLGKSGTSLGLSRVLPKVFLSAISGEMPNNALSTHSFLRTCRKVSGIDPRSFAEQWIYGSGCPTFGFSASFNRKKMAVEIQMKQEAPAYQYHENSESMKLLYKPVPFFEGQMTIRIHEADGTPYEHVLDIRSPFKRYEVPFNTKYKRVRRNTKRYLARQAAAQAAAEGDAEAAAAMDMIDMGFGLEIWEKEKERENWKVADWTEEDEQNMSGQTYEWIRIDADFEWIANISFDQKDYMWVSQLQRDRDVVAQYEAITVLKKMSQTAVISSTFTKTVLVTNYSFRIRCEAAQALVTCATHRLDWLGLFHLFKLFLRYCYEPDDPNQDLFTHTYVPRPNDFSEFAEYFVRKSLLQAISRVRFDNGKTPPIVRQFLIDQLRYNDNTSNAYNDALYICNIISALACSTVSKNPPERGEFVTTDMRPILDTTDADLLKQASIEIDRYRSMDRLIPSVHNVVSIATLEFHTILSLANLTPHDARILIPLTREGNYTQVRMAAFDCLFLTKWYTPSIMQYILAVMANDSSRMIRRHVARNACQSLALLVTMGELESGKKSKSVLVEEDGVGQDTKKEAKKSEIELMIKALRKDPEVGKNEAIRQFLIPMAMSPDTDHEVRWCLFKLGDLLIKPAEELPPKVTIHLPPTPVLEVPPPLPTPKPAIKPQRSLSIKAGGAIVKSPLTPVTIPPKIKLPLNGTRIDVTPRTPATPSALPFMERRRESGSSFTKPPLPRKVELQRPPKAVPKSRSGGMDFYDEKACKAAVKKLRNHKRSYFFRQPVDPVRDRAPNYFEVIKNPMDLSTMSAKLDQGMYKDRSAFEQDFRLLISNAKQYNMPKSAAYGDALELEKAFEIEWARITKTIEAKIRETNQPRPGTPGLKITAVQRKVAPNTSAPATPSPAPSAATPSRPTIKLKMGGLKTNGTPLPTPSAETAQTISKVRVRKPKEPKLSEVPPPEPRRESYFDHADVDDELLEEVIAIERAKNEERKLHRASAEKDKEQREKEKELERAREKEKARQREQEKSKPEQTIPKLIIGKRKKSAPADDPVEDDEILALATPAKKEKSAASSPAPALPIAGPSSVNSSERGSAKASPAPTPVPQTKNGTFKDERASSSAPKVSIKGKEKEVARASPAPKPKKSAISQASSTPLNEKKCREILKVLTKPVEAAIFLRPVDTQLDGCPTYYDEIKNPMDFGTMSAKLSAGDYKTMEEFGVDVDLVIANCRQFNPPGTYPDSCAKAVEAIWKPLWAKTMVKKLSYQEKRTLQGVINKLAQDPISFVFLEPVDPVLLGIPTYHDVIPKHKARDLRTIRTKLDSDKYDSIEALVVDLDLMVDNAILFNGADSEVGQLAMAVRDKYQDLLAPLKGSATGKRKGSEKGTPQPSKKARLG
ncbi:hypothetical protein BC835DRAFT_1276761 [Cytidiella melzeri]|nr:hypothetical protein BC835DRAFT_1276761 [Cytidiella melzeri]